MSSEKIKVFIADEIHSSGIRKLKNAGFDVFEPYGLTNKQLADYISKRTSAESKIRDSVLIIRTTRRLDKQDISMLYKLTGLKLLCAASSGYDNIDIKAARDHGFHVTNCPDSTFVSAAEHSIAMLLAITKNIVPAAVEMNRGIFDFKSYKNSELKGKTIGIIGFGRVGSSVAKIARSFGMKILGNDINPRVRQRYKQTKFVSLAKLLRESDIVTVHTPLDASTRNLINSVNMKLLRKGCIILNCARGGIVNERALISALKSGKVSYCGIDVFENEPIFNRMLAMTGRALLTPHLAGKTIESKIRVSEQLAERIIDYYGGKRKSISIC